MPDASKKSRLTSVLDSNVIISAFTHGGTPRTVLDLLWLGEMECAISPFILAEVGKSLREDFDWVDSAVERTIAALKRHCVLVHTRKEASISGLSLADNRILDCAVQGRIQYLITGDKGIQQVREFQGVKILSPTEFLALIQ